MDLLRYGDVMCNVRNKSESFCTYVPTYHRLQSTMRLIFNLGECLHLFSCLFSMGLNLKLSGLLLQKIQLKTPFATIE